MCGVDGEVEEMSDEEDVVKVDLEDQEGAVVEKIKAEKDERHVKDMVDPRRPSRQEVITHERTHLPCRNWCSICVQAEGRNADHRKCQKEERGLSEYSFDYCFPVDVLGCKLTVLVGRERVTGTYSATMVPTKGSSGQFTLAKILETIYAVGDARQTIIMKTDQEPSIKALVEDLVHEREDGRTIVEESSVKSSGSNGVVERAVQGVEGHIRVVLSALEEKIGRLLDPLEAVVSSIPEYAAYLLDRLEVGKDGKTAYEGTKGKKATVVGLEFGEKVLWRKKKAD